MVGGLKGVSEADVRNGRLGNRCEQESHRKIQNGMRDTPTKGDRRFDFSRVVSSETYKEGTVGEVIEKLHTE